MITMRVAVAVFMGWLQLEVSASPIAPSHVFTVIDSVIPPTKAPTQATKPSRQRGSPLKPSKSSLAQSPIKPTSPTGLIHLDPAPAPSFNNLFAISTDKSSYAFNSTVTVNYVSAQPRRDDFIAIVPMSTPTGNVSKGLFWLWTCNQQGNVCSNAEKKGTVTFGPDGPASGWEWNWPLPAGQYQAYLLRDAASPPYPVVAQSKVFTVHQTFEEALAGAKAAITRLVESNFAFIPQFIRIIFHDCIGGCDGCIDMTNQENSGLSSTIDVLTMVSDAYANNFTGLSRADVWAMATIVAADLANKGSHRKPINFTYDWVGRVDCEVANKVCFNASNQVVPCSAKAGPNRDTPGPNLNTTGFFSFFDQVFGFSPEQAVAAMGAHSVGRLFRENSGIDGPDGWEINNQQLHSEYYEALLGSATAKSKASDILAKSPKWDHIFLNNSEFNRPNRFFWRLNVVGKNLSMLNADVSMVRDLNNKNMNPVTGKVSCAFNPNLGEKPLCPLAETVTIAQKFLDNDVWLAQFKSVLDLMSTTGYIRKKCTQPPCRLIRKL